MFRKIVILLGLGFVLLAGMQLTACCDTAKDSKTYCVSINTTYVVAYNNNGIEPVPAKQTEVYGEALILELNFDRNVAVCYQKESNSFFFKAYAMCRPIDRYRYADSITYVTISADRAYSSQHAAGAELNEFFNMPLVSEFNDGGDFTSTKIAAIKGPEEAGIYVYTIKVLLADGKLIEASTEPVNIIR